MALYHALALAAGKPDQAQGVADVLLEKYDSAASRKALLRTCLCVGVTSPGVAAWMDALRAAKEDTAEF